MDEKIKQLRSVFDELFSREIYNGSYIEVLDQEELILAANEEGFLYLIDKIIKLCEKQSEHEHYVYSALSGPSARRNKSIATETSPL